jgi:hypothetical protein
MWVSGEELELIAETGQGQGQGGTTLAIIVI